MPLKEAMIAYGGVTFVNGAVAMIAVYVLWIAGVV
jgi:hypothetical protein